MPTRTSFSSAVFFLALSCGQDKRELTPSVQSEHRSDVPMTAEDDSVGRRLEVIAGLDEAEVRQFLGKLRTIVSSRDREALAAVVAYPFDVNLDGQMIEITDEESFVEQYDRVVTANVRDAVLHEEFDELFVNWRGVMIGNGQVWFSGVCQDKKCSTHILQVIAINP